MLRARMLRARILSTCAYQRRQAFVLRSISRLRGRPRAGAALLPRLFGIQPDSLPLRIRRVFQISREGRELFDLGWQYRRFHMAVLAMGDRAKKLGHLAAFG